MPTGLNSIVQLGRSLPADAPTSVRRKADEDLYDALKSGGFCCVLKVVDDYGRS